MNAGEPGYTLVFFGPLRQPFCFFWVIGVLVLISLLTLAISPGTAYGTTLPKVGHPLPAPHMLPDTASSSKPFLTPNPVPDSFSDTEPLLQIPPESLEAWHDLHKQLTPDKRQSTHSGDWLASNQSEDESEVKRRVRVKGMHMRGLLGPEAAYQVGFINSEEEWGSRHSIAATMPLTEIWEGAILDHLSLFSLKNANHNAAREAVDLRIVKNPSQSLRPWFILTPYFNFGDAEGEGMGLTAGMSKSWTNGASFTGEVFAWRPWDEGYYTIIEDGRKFGATFSFSLPLMRDFFLSGRSWYEELELGTGAKSGSQYAGHRYAINARAYYRLFYRAGEYMGYGFRNDDLWDAYLVETELGVFMHVDFQRYFKPAGFKALNPVSEVFAQDVGIACKYPISSHIGFIGEAYIGRDPDRDLQFGEIGGVNGRLIIAINPHVRLWGGLGYTRTNTTLESSGGDETIVSFGINYNF